MEVALHFLYRGNTWIWEVSFTPHTEGGYSMEASMKQWGGRSNDSLLALSTYASRVPFRTFIPFLLLIFYVLITEAWMFVLIMADSGKSRTRNIHKYLFGVTSVVIGCSHLWTFWADGVASAKSVTYCEAFYQSLHVQFSMIIMTFRRVGVWRYC